MDWRRERISEQEGEFLGNQGEQKELSKAHVGMIKINKNKPELEDEQRQRGRVSMGLSATAPD